MEEQKQTEQQPIKEQQPVEEKENDGVLRPNVSYEELLKKSQVPNQQMNARIEAYNHNQGFKPMEPVQPSTKEKPVIQVGTGKVDIKPPKKKSNPLVTVLLLLVLVALGVGTYYYYTEIYLKSPAPTQSNPNEDGTQEGNDILEEAKDKVTSCSLESSYPAFGYTLTTTYRYYTSEGKLKRYEEDTLMEYLEDSINEQSVCMSVSSRYLGYEGYSYLCTQKDAKNYQYTKVIDLTVLTAKELTFNNGQFPTTVKIEQTLDEPIISYIEKHEGLGFTCEEQPYEFIEEEPIEIEEEDNTEEDSFQIPGNVI